MTLNLELGVLTHGGPLPAQVEERLGRLEVRDLLHKLAGMSMSGASLGQVDPMPVPAFIRIEG